MANRGPINGAAINAGFGGEFFLEVDAALPSLTASIVLRDGTGTGVDQVLPSLQAEIAFGGTIDVTLPKLEAEIAFTTQPIIRVESDLPALTAEIVLSPVLSILIEGTLPALTGELLGGGGIDARLPALTADLAFSVETLLSAAGQLPALKGEVEFSTPDTLKINVTLPALIADGFDIDASLPSLQGEAVFTADQVLQLVAYAMNIATQGVTQYSNYPFQHITRFKGKSYGFDDTGGYLLEGDDDAGADIDAYIDIPETNFGTSQKKNVPYVYISARSATKFAVTVTTDGGRTSTADTRTVGRNKRAKLPRGLQGTHWAHRISNISGGQMDIDTVEVLPEIKGRKV